MWLTDKKVRLLVFCKTESADQWLDWEEGIAVQCHQSKAYATTSKIS